MFKLIRQEEIKSLELELLEFEHVETKAKHIHLKADDIENSYICGFKTVPYSNNGIKHILEHSVLQGSQMYPVKDSFNSIYKKSLKTFMNASTTTDHTYYPFSSANKKDFFNLMSVYNDAMFFPLLRKETFLQEGWRYEFAEPDNAESKLTVNGVVFNEMKGILSSPGAHLWNNAIKSLYPDTTYAYDSGGIPLNIPELTYEEFLNYHKENYHPSNAVFLTYGDIDYAEIHEEIENNVLSKFDYKEINIDNPYQPAFDKPQKLTVEYPYSEEDFAEQNFYLKLYHATDISNTDASFEIEFLSSLISSGADSALTKALEKSGLFTSTICTSAENGRDVFFLFGGAGVKPEDTAKVDELINKTIAEVAANGFSEAKIEKELHSFELSQKSKSTGRSTYGLNMLEAILAAAIHNVDASIFLKADIALDTLKEKLADKNYLQSLVKEHLIDNKQTVDLLLLASPEKAKQDELTAQANIDKHEASLTDEDKQAIIEDSKALDAYQALEDEEGILPELTVADIPLEIDMQNLETKTYKDTSVFAFKAPTSGLTYLSQVSFLKDIKASDVQYLNLYSFLTNVIGYSDKSFDQASESISSICDNIHFNVDITEDRHDADKIYVRSNISSKMLNKNRKAVKELTDEVVNNRRFDEKDRIIFKIKDLANHQNLSMFSIDNGLESSGDLAKANLSKIDRVSFDFTGLGYTKFIKDLAANIDNDEVFENLTTKLKEIDAKVTEAYSRAALCVMDLEDNLDETIEIFFDNHKDNIEKFSLEYDLTPVTAKALVSDKTGTNYCSLVMPAPYLDHELAGAYIVLSRIIGNEYLHPEVREKGGAYGGDAGFYVHSEMFKMISYYDPNMSKTFETFLNVDKWLLDEANITQKHVDESIIQAMASFDAPKLKVVKCSRALNRYFDEVTNDDLLKLREMILKTTMPQIRRVINELIIPNLPKATLGLTANKTQFNNEKPDMEIFEM